jgi:hypothetical protein
VDRPGIGPDWGQEPGRGPLSAGGRGPAACGIGPVTGRNEGQDCGPPAGPADALGNGPVAARGIGPDG